MARMRYQQALARALRDEMLRDPSVFVLGEDVRASLRGVTRGLAAELGEQRIIDTPISEQAFTGFAMGAALAGHRPVVEFQIPSLLFTAFEPIVNQAQKFRLMTGGQAKVPVTYIVPGSGARMGLAAQHSDHPYALFAQAGVKTVVPATASDAYGLFLASIRDDDPVVFFAPAAALGSREEVADDADAIPLGVGRVHRDGEDVTVVAVGHLVRDALKVAEALAESDGISVEVFDPRTVHPFDWDGLAASVRKTGRLVVIDDTNRTCGLAAEIVATAAEELADALVAPPRRITRADAPIPFAVELEVALLPSREQLAAAIRSVVTVPQEALR
ncbi:transketolase C-terminal domain-containing protein [Conexibacter stalactiti]|uniref:Transketolase C-terminal domain-containing protein n=1 Tax=Conexibacter stalactiti TaxID=1940611 RepID=A0ABU4HJT7_9ACTN|nr:transketolase C-terminal domain-containing protein [Conexibacter stalactiti]MDW5593573.1 transketolase C-terminal domain-containing protein [Conexibacter stalactiti]MEC5034214.1 transketolase C-terminal domain-containing protein [Conexibacter stalactiti]